MVWIKRLLNRLLRDRRLNYITWTIARLGESIKVYRVFCPAKAEAVEQMLTSSKETVLSATGIPRLGSKLSGNDARNKIGGPADRVPIINSPSFGLLDADEGLLQAKSTSMLTRIYPGMEKRFLP